MFASPRLSSCCVLQDEKGKWKKGHSHGAQSVGQFPTEMMMMPGTFSHVLGALRWHIGQAWRLTSMSFVAQTNISQPASQAWVLWRVEAAVFRAVGGLMKRNERFEDVFSQGPKKGSCVSWRGVAPNSQGLNSNAKACGLTEQFFSFQRSSAGDQRAEQGRVATPCGINISIRP